MNKPSLVEVISTISSAVECNACPYPCSTEWNTSLEDCERHWYDIISNLDIIPWDEAVKEYLQYKKELREIELDEIKNTFSTFL